MKKKINKNKGILFWITGLSGSGKTVLAEKIKKDITKKYGPTLLVSGDDLRKIFKFNKYTAEERKILGKYYCNFAKFITNKNIQGPDISSSINEDQLKELIINSKRIITQMKGDKHKLLKQEEITRRFAFASVAALQDIKKNSKFNSDNIFPVRPSSGFYKVKDYNKLLGLRAKRDIKKGFQLKLTDVKKN